jgi:ATP-binding cassette subfamily C exporter for protease/lipase
MKAKGKTVILITHRPGILAVADRLLLLQDGRVQAEGPRDAVLAALQAARTPAPAAPAAAVAAA